MDFVSERPGSESHWLNILSFHFIICKQPPRVVVKIKWDKGCENAFLLLVRLFTNNEGSSDCKLQKPNSKWLKVKKRKSLTWLTSGTPGSRFQMTTSRLFLHLPTLLSCTLASPSGRHFPSEWQHSNNPSTSWVTPMEIGYPIPNGSSKVLRLNLNELIPNPYL